MPFGLGWAIGWDSKDAMLCSAAASAAVLAPAVAARAAGAAPAWLLPFRLGISVFGGVALLLAGLLRSSLMYSKRRIGGHGARGRAGLCEVWCAPAMHPPTKCMQRERQRRRYASRESAGGGAPRRSSPATAGVCCSADRSSAAPALRAVQHLPPATYPAPLPLKTPAGAHAALVDYWAVNAAYCGLLSAFAVAGALCGAPSLTACGLTFAFLYAGEKAFEIGCWVEDARAPWVVGLAASAAAWRAGLFLSSRPGWLAALLGVGDGLLLPAGA